MLQKRRGGAVSGDVEGPGICCEDNRSLKSDFEGKAKRRVSLAVTLGEEAKAQNLFSVTTPGDCRSGDGV